MIFPLPNAIEALECPVHHLPLKMQLAGAFVCLVHHIYIYIYGWVCLLLEGTPVLVV